MAFVFHGPINFCRINPILYIYNVDILDMCTKEFGTKYLFFDKMKDMRSYCIYLRNPPTHTVNTLQQKLNYVKRIENSVV